jgi:hypothetical protein
MKEIIMHGDIPDIVIFYFFWISFIIFCIIGFIFGFTFGKGVALGEKKNKEEE